VDSPYSDRIIYAALLTIRGVAVGVEKVTDVVGAKDTD